LAGRIFTECYATDSFQNILFSLLFFPTHVNSISASASTAPTIQRLSIYPSNLTIISHAFKHYRFVALHLPALKYPFTTGGFKYIGIDPTMDEVKRAEIEVGELSRGVKAWEQDPYGVGTVLAEKRRARGWTRGREQSFWSEFMEGGGASGDEDMMSFVQWLGALQDEQARFIGKFPWS
jgi:hypothetical protein